MHNYSLRKSSRRRERRPPNPAEALSVVLANVPLPKSTLAALRLVSRGVRLAVDNATTDLELSGETASFRPKKCKFLISGLTSISLIISESATVSSVRMAYGVAKYNAKTLQRLILKAEGPLDANYTHFDRCFSTVSTLAACKMPHLTQLHTFCTPDIFQSGIKIALMPKLADLELSGWLKGADLAALRRNERFCATLERLSLRVAVTWGEPDHAFYNALKKLLQATPKLYHLALDVNKCRCRDLGFLDGAELLSLRELHLSGIPDNCSLSPITSSPRNSLEALSLSGGRANAAELQAIVSAEPAVLPSLQCLKVGLKCGGYSFLSSISTTKLTALHLDDSSMCLADVTHVAAALARLPLLEDLRLCPSHKTAEDGVFLQSEATVALLSGPVMPRLRRLETGKAWMDFDHSVEILCQSGHKIPNLEELIFGSGYIGWRGVSRLATAGRAGRWAHLRLLYIDAIDPEESYESDEVVNPERCINLLQEAWPEAKIEIGDDGDGDGAE